MKTRLISIFLLLLFMAVAGFGQGVQTATLEGKVTDPDGMAIPGVSISVKSPALLGERTTVTGANGDYLLRGLPPGDYTVKYQLEGMQTVTRKLTLGLGLTARSDVTLKLAAVAEAITVTAASPSVLETPTAGQNITASTVVQLPVTRTPTGIASLAPGVTGGDRGGRAGTPVAGQVSISGGMAYDNALLINGVNFADTVFGSTNTLYIEDAIQETQVLTSGISAEYGHFTGGVLNVITKSGGNQFTGTLRDNISNPTWTALTPYEEGFRGEGVTPAKKAPHKDTMSNVYELTFGGPILRDRIWFFLAGRDEKSATAFTTGVTGYPYTVNLKNRRPEYKLTANIASNHTIQGDYINNPIERDVEGQLSPIDTTALFRATKRENDGYSVFYNGVLTNNLFAEARYSQKKFAFVGLGGWERGIVDSPFRAKSDFPNAGTGTFNAPYWDATDPEERNNDTGFLALSYFLSKPTVGTHDIKVGYEQFTDTRTGGNSQTATDYVFYTGYVMNGSSPALDANGHLIPLFRPFTGENADYTGLGMWLATRGAKLDATTDTLFVNDRWTLNTHWSFNLGLRYEQVKATATGGITTIDTTSTVPRLAASFDPMGNGKYKFDVTYAEYAGRYNPALTGANTPVGNPALLYGYYIGPEGQGRSFAPGFDPKNYVFYYADVPTGNVYVGKGLHSPVSQEYTAAGGMQLPHNGFVKLTFTDRKYKDFIETFTTFDLGCTDIALRGVAAGCFDNVLYKNSNIPKRHYQAVEIQARYDLTRAWSLEGNWTHQLKNDGNYEGESGQSIGTTVLGDYPELTVPQRQAPTGRLNMFEEDKIRIWTAYNFNFNRFGNLTTGLIWRYDSALPFSYSATVARSSIMKAKDPGYKNEPNTVTTFFGDRGIGRFNSTSLFDVSLMYALPIANRITPFVKADVRNVFNDDTQISWNTNVTADSASALDEWGYRTGYKKSASFGRPTSTNSYVLPREYYFQVGVRF